MSRLALSRWLIGHTARLVPILVLAVVARVANQLLAVALFVLPAVTLAQIANGVDASLGAMIVWMIGIALAKALLRYAEHYSGHWVAFTALQRLRELFFARLVPQAPAATTGRAGAELTERATRDIDRIEVFFAHTLPPAVSAIVVPAVALSWLAVAYEGALAVSIAVCIALLILVLPLLANGSTWRGARRIATARGTIAAHIGDDVQGVREVLAFAAEDSRLASLDRAEGNLVAARRSAGNVQAVRAVLGSILQAAALIAPLLVALTTDAPLPALAAALAVAVSLITPARGVDDFATGLDAAFAATDRIRRVIDAPPRVNDEGTGEDAGGEIVFDGVSMQYPDTAHPALNDITLRFAPGSWNTVVGVSGSGKSTLATLVMRGLDPDVGTVSLGGHNLRELSLDALRGTIALVPQRPTMLSGTLADNLRLAAADADDDALRQALRTVALEQWTDALDAPIGERGTTVSGGQLQRLALARALVARPEVLILDEALSQLDAETAQTVRSRLAADHPGLTVIEITHRVDLVADESPVFVIDAARLIEQGTAGELRVEGTAFRRLEARV